MKSGSVKYIIALLLFGILDLSCSSSIFPVKKTLTSDNKYDSEFPSQNASDQLDEIGNTIYRVSSIAFYQTYSLKSTSKIKKSDLTDEVIKNNTLKTTVVDKPALGTGTLIYSHLGTVGILTCAHVIDFPDTIFTYYAEENGAFSDYLQSVSFKTKQDIYIAGFPKDSKVDVILKDDKNDVALLGRQYDISSTSKLRVFSYPFGNSRQLEWGTFVYLMGYPLNYKMLSTAVVSSPNLDRDGSFLINAPINMGYSGGIILALRDGVPNFELVGIVQSIPEESDNVLQPAAIDDKYNYSPLVPYKGDVYAKQLKIFKYGIAKVVPINTIIKIFNEHKDYLQDKGYRLSIFE